MSWENRRTVKELFADYFTGTYTGSYGNTESHLARRDFIQLTNSEIIWAQVHGDFKNVAKRALFEPYPHWEALYRAVQDVLKAHIDLDTEYWGLLTNAKIMGDVMTVMRDRHGLNVPRWWLPIINKLREKGRKER